MMKILSSELFAQDYYYDCTLQLDDGTIVEDVTVVVNHDHNTDAWTLINVEADADINLDSIDIDEVIDLSK